MRIAYYAEDGTEFETQSQCEAYEKEQENARKNFTCMMMMVTKSLCKKSWMEIVLLLIISTSERIRTCNLSMRYYLNSMA